MIVEQVELTPTQLADKAQSRAKKALDANDLASAINYYNDALRYTPRDSQVRQKLVALYYGKGEVRKAVDLLQKGIALSQDDMGLRIALTKLLLKEKQNTAALTPLVYLPSNPTVEYLSLRAVLAQKSAQDEMAQESYQKLVQLEPDNGRWWLGLGIQLERGFKLTQAAKVYQQALNKVGLSSQSQQFIRDRLALLSRLEEQTNAN
ncbi:MAG TPA: MSHA biogenesis protein MshN [Vibrio sp.]|nr:MSHA biogenesis protein MshN [Vibrio sp.]